MGNHEHEHDPKHECGCGCGHEHDHDHEDCCCEDADMIYLTLDDDTELECQILGVFEVGEQEYIALLPVAEEDDEESAVLIYRYSEDGEGNPELTMIETDEEFATVSEVFDALWGEDEDEDEDE